MFDFNDYRRLSTMLHPLPEGVSAVCVLGAPARPENEPSEDGLHDAFLWRPYLEQQWGGPDSELLMFVLMNPSSADAEYNDNTTRKCMEIAREHGFGGMVVTEVWALRSTGNEWLLAEPGAAGSDMEYLQMFTSGDIDVGTDYYQNLMHLHGDIDFIAAALQNPRVETVYCGWGSHPEASAQVRIQKISSVLQASGKNIVCGGQNEDGSPRYALYTPAGSPFVPYNL